MLWWSGRTSRSYLRQARWDCRSSAFRTLAQTFVVAWSESRRAVAMVGAGGIGSGLHEDGGLPPVGVVHARLRQVDYQDDRLRPARPLLLEHRVETLAEPAQLAKRVQDTGRPVHPDNEPPGGGRRLVERAPILVAIRGEGRLDHPGHAVRRAGLLVVLEGVQVAAEGLDA